MATPPPRPGVLIVDDDRIVAESLVAFLRAEAVEARCVHTAADAVAALTNGAGQDIGIVLADLSLPAGSPTAPADGIGLIRELHRLRPEIAIIAVTGFATVPAAVEALRSGAVDLLTKPVIDDELDLALERAGQQHTLLAENVNLRRRVGKDAGGRGVVGRDPRMRRVFELVEAVAPSRTTVLMTGESGTGKSLIARAIHDRSPRRAESFVELSCGSIPESLLESELFGHVRGAFTGAHADKIGRFLAADGGTIFLDEINSASPAMQLKLLRVLQERRFEPVGSTESIEVDARVILAANEPLERLVAEGRFRQDLYYRVNVVAIDLPPLRDRLSDIPMLAEHFLERMGEELGRRFAGFSTEALDALRRYTYPGNIRELSNVIERAAVLSRSQTIGVDDLPPTLIDPSAPATFAPTIEEEPSEQPWVPIPLTEALREPERRIIRKALEANDWNRQQTADDLGINRTTLYKKMKWLGIETPDEGRAGAA